MKFSPWTISLLFVAFTSFAGEKPAMAPPEKALGVAEGEGLELQVTALTRSEDRLWVKIQAWNRNHYSSGLHGAAGTWLETADGTRLEYIPTTKNPRLELPANSTVEGHLVFSGVASLSADATLTLNINGGNTGGDLSQWPALRIEGLSLQDASVRESISSVSDKLWDPPLDVQVGKSWEGYIKLRHPSGLEVGVRKVEPGKDFVKVGLSAWNNSKEVIELAGAGQLLLLEPNGYQHRLVSRLPEPTLPVQPGEVLDGEYYFSGALSPEAEYLELLINPHNQKGESTQQPYILLTRLPAQAWEAGQ